MSGAVLSRLAKAAGLVLDWEDTQGVPRRVAPDAVRAILAALGHSCRTDADCRESLAGLAAAPEPDFLTVDAGAAFRLSGVGRRARLHLEDGEVREVAIAANGRVPAIDVIGYHRLEIEDREIGLAVCPARCLTPRELLGRRAFGLTAQIYSLSGPGGFGDFGDLARLATQAGRSGADALAISPVHALFSADPTRYSPYSPSSREALNPLFADPSVLGARRRAAIHPPLIDWPAAGPAKLAELAAAADLARDDPRLAAFVAEGGPVLRRFALFEALHGHFLRTAGIRDWRRWPAAFRKPETAAAAAADLDLDADVAFHLMVQWLADLGLGGAQAAAKAAGMGIGLVADLAVGLDPAGAQAWARPGDLLSGLTLGAPPDAFQAEGQGWGITSFSPDALRRQGFAPFLRTLRAALRHAGGVRIDHALGLKRLWVLPDGASPLDGAYLQNPFEDLLRLIALESRRAGAVVIGEDLGVVPPGLRDTLWERGLLGMRVLPFERLEDGGFRRPQDYDPGAAAMTSTHDLPPFAGWWRGRDIDWRERLGAIPDRRPDDAGRARARQAFWSAASAAGVATGPQPPAREPDAAVDAAIALTAKTPCELLLVPLEDLAGLDQPVNLPGVVDQHPNWRRRMPQDTEVLFQRPEVRRRLDRLAAERPK